MHVFFTDYILLILVNTKIKSKGTKVILQYVTVELVQCLLFKASTWKMSSDPSQPNTDFVLYGYTSATIITIIIYQ